jgi:hypothetical protein
MALKTEMTPLLRDLNDDSGSLTMNSPSSDSKKAEDTPYKIKVDADEEEDRAVVKF